MDLVGAGRNRDAIGASVTLRAGELTLLRHCLNGGSYLSQHDTRLHFGLGGVDRIESIEIVWPDGTKQRLEDVEVDRYLRVEQATSGPRVGDVQAPPADSVGDRRE